MRRDLAVAQLVLADEFVVIGVRGDLHLHVRNNRIHVVTARILGVGGVARVVRDGDLDLYIIAGLKMVRRGLGVKAKLAVAQIDHRRIYRFTVRQRHRHSVAHLDVTVHSAGDMHFCIVIQLVPVQNIVAANDDGIEVDTHLRRRHVRSLSFIGAGAIAERVHILCGPVAQVHAPVQLVQMVDAVKQVAVAQVAIAGGAGGRSRRRTGGGHQVRAEGAEKVRPGHQGAVHFKVRHAFLGILGVEIGKLNAGTVVKTEDQVVAGALHRSLIRRKLQDQTGIGHAVHNHMLSRLRASKNKIRHCFLLSVNRECGNPTAKNTRRAALRSPAHERSQ